MSGASPRISGWRGPIRSPSSPKCGGGRIISKPPKNCDRARRCVMRLRHSASSPYVRKVMVVAHETGLEPRIERVPTFVWSPDTDIADDNPIGKVPTLILDDGTALFDSPVICEYLDSLHAGERLFPAAGPPRCGASSPAALRASSRQAGSRARPPR